MKPILNRRRVLRGMLGGGVVTVGLPLLECFLNPNGTALASGAPLPLCFATWFQGLVFSPGFWEPKVEGPNYEMAHMTRALTPIRDKVNIISGLKVHPDSHPANAHGTGPEVVFYGGIDTPSAPSFDSIIADQIGTRTRFRSVEVSCEGSQETHSRRNARTVNPSENSPTALYARIFGPEFKDPNAADFMPDPKVIMRKSVLSQFGEERASIVSQLGATDRVLLDEYFTSLRTLENQLAVSLEKPQPLPACSMPQKGEEAERGRLIEDVIHNHKLFAGLLAHALACGQTQVINVNFGGSTSNIRRPGTQQSFHMYTHEEPTDPKLGYQPNCEWFSNQAMEALLTFVKTLESIREGNGTLLDRSLALFLTDGGYARVHGLENIPAFTIGKAGGRMKTGIHVQVKGDPITRVGLTAMQAMGVPMAKWGTESNATSNPFTEIMA